MRFSLVEFSLALVLVVEIYKYVLFFLFCFFSDAFLVATTRLVYVCVCLLFTLVEL